MAKDEKCSYLDRGEQKYIVCIKMAQIMQNKINGK